MHSVWKVLCPYLPVSPEPNMVQGRQAKNRVLWKDIFFLRGPLPAAGRDPADADIQGANHLPVKTQKSSPFYSSEIH